MAHGLELYAANGNLTYSSADVTWNQVGFFYVTPGSPLAVDLPVIAGRQVLTQQMFIDPPPTDRKAIAHTVTVQGTQVFASGGSERAYVLVLMR